MAVADPTLEVEQQLHAAGTRLIIGCDEVGRGAIAGPVAVGLSVVDAEIGPFPVGLRDSKMLSEKKRELLAPLAADWVRASSVGLASAVEVDDIGIMAALGLAASRALEIIAPRFDLADAVILLDGSHDWFSPHVQGGPRVVARVKADRDCASVAAASVVAKVHRDRLMIDADEVYPGYGWPGNKGYASAAHYEAIERLGVTGLHRRTWIRTPEPALF